MHPVEYLYILIVGEITGIVRGISMVHIGLALGLSLPLLMPYSVAGRGVQRAGISFAPAPLYSALGTITLVHRD